MVQVLTLFFFTGEFTDASEGLPAGILKCQIRQFGILKEMAVKVLVWHFGTFWHYSSNLELIFLAWQWHSILASF